jgi:RNA polymerase sigma factor (TIGR02999 family)
MQPQPDTNVSPFDNWTSVYHELKEMARLQMAREKPGHTLQPTALVNEVWLRLQTSPPSLPDESMARRRYFFASAAEAMRRILVEQARHKQTLKAGGQFQREDAELAEFAAPLLSSELLAVHEALDDLARHDALKAELVKLRYFAGCTNKEAADILGLTTKSAEKHWVYARAWLQDRLPAQ